MLKRWFGLCLAQPKQEFVLAAGAAAVFSVFDMAQAAAVILTSYIPAAVGPDSRSDFHLLHQALVLCSLSYLPNYQYSRLLSVVSEAL